MRIRTGVATIAAAAALFVGPALAGPTGAVLGHAQLVSSTPGAGQALDAPPTELRLAFSEPLVVGYSSLDLATAAGGVLLAAGGAPDPIDPRTLVAPIPSTLENGTYLVTWRTLSAADGHAATGFFSFAVGRGGVIVSSDHGHGASTHGHDDPVVRAFEIGARTASYGGLLVAFGLGLLAFAFRRASPRLLAAASEATWVSLIVAAAGAAGMLVLAAALLPTSGGGFDLTAYAANVRTGQLMTVRIAATLAGAVATFALAGAGRAAAAVLMAAGTALVGFATSALGGHQAAFNSPAPVLVDIVHLGAGGLWLSGLGAVAWLATRRVPREELTAVVTRYSAVALVSVALLGLTGAYQAWIGLGSFSEELGSEFGTALLVKVAVFLAAVALGAWNYLSGGRSASFRARVLAESALAIGVIVLSANLTIASPPGPARPIDLAPATADGTADVELALLVGRPGANGFVTRLATPVAAGDVVALVLRRIDVDAGTTRIRLAADDATGQRFRADGALLAATSRWDATVVVADGAGGAETLRERFRFAFDLTGLIEGRRLPAIDPAVLVALALIAAAVVGLTFGLAGGRLPRTDGTASRAALLAGGVAGGAVGLAILLGGGS